MFLAEDRREAFERPQCTSLNLFFSNPYRYIPSDRTPPQSLKYILFCWHHNLALDWLFIPRFPLDFANLPPPPPILQPTSSVHDAWIQRSKYSWRISVTTD